MSMPVLVNCVGKVLVILPHDLMQKSHHLAGQVEITLGKMNDIPLFSFRTKLVNYRHNNSNFCRIVSVLLHMSAGLKAYYYICFPDSEHIIMYVSLRAYIYICHPVFRCAPL
jgi:hypothetical protein